LALRLKGINAIQKVSELEVNGAVLHASDAGDEGTGCRRGASGQLLPCVVEEQHPLDAA
jgi:hypothetical protein